jgi:hypothetical protein
VVAVAVAGRIAEGCQRIQNVREGVNQQSEIKCSHVVFSSVLSALIGAT